jgi:phosphoribosylanthranilate isomerase
MNNKTVLVRDITSLSEARYCAGMQVDFIAFEFNPMADNYISDLLRNEIIQWLSGVKIVGTYQNGSLTEIKNCIESQNLSHFIFEFNQKDYLNSIVLDKKFLEIYDNNISISFPEDVIMISDSVLDHKNQIFGYDFSNPLKQANAQGYAFKGCKELRPGLNAYDELMDALEAIENI